MYRINLGVYNITIKSWLGQVGIDKIEFIVKRILLHTKYKLTIRTLVENIKTITITNNNKTESWIKKLKQLLFGDMLYII